MNERKCPICGRYYDEQPALSRKDNKTEICSICGMKEAIRGMLRYDLPKKGVDNNKQIKLTINE